MTGRWPIALFSVLLPLSIQAADSFLDHFSTAFRASVDMAMEQSDPEQRARLLIDAMHAANDNEVFFVLPLLFPPPLLDTAKQSNSCLAEITASVGNVEAYIASPEAEQMIFATSHADKIRPDTDALIKCICKYYDNGQLYFPGKQPNNSFKPKPLRGSA